MSLLALSLVAATVALDAPVAFVDVHLFDPARAELERSRTVVVEGGRIVAVGPVDATVVPDGAVRVDGAGRVLAPGLVEWHGHLPQDGVPAESVEAALWTWLAHGVTTVRGMLGAPSQLALRDAIERGERDGPRLLVGSPPLGGMQSPSAKAASELVASYAAAGYDLLKVHEGLSPDAHEAIGRAAREHDIAFGGHVSNGVGVEAALANGQRTIDHLDNLLEWLTPGKDVRNVPVGQLLAMIEWERLDALAAMLHRHGAAVVPTLALFENLFGGRTPDAIESELGDTLSLIAAPVRAQWRAAVEANSKPFAEAGPKLVDARRRLLAELHARRVPVLLGTDSPQIYSVPGASVLRELESYVAAGLSRREALATASTQVAAFTGAPLEYGPIAVGRRADLLLLDGDPGEDLGVLARPAGVLANGRWHDRAALDARLAEIRERAH